MSIKGIEDNNRCLNSHRPFKKYPSIGSYILNLPSNEKEANIIYEEAASRGWNMFDADLWDAPGDLKVFHYKALVGLGWNMNQSTSMGPLYQRIFYFREENMFDVLQYMKTEGVNFNTTDRFGCGWETSWVAGLTDDARIGDDQETVFSDMINEINKMKEIGFYLKSESAEDWVGWLKVSMEQRTSIGIMKAILSCASEKVLTEIAKIRIEKFNDDSKIVIDSAQAMLLKKSITTKTKTLLVSL